jgi:methionyl-tRNA synthetase
MTHKLYVTTSIPYVNAAPHVGFALELVQADVAARFNRLIGRSVRFQTGSDENAFKNVLAAAEKGISTADFVRGNTQRFGDLISALNISTDDFLATTQDRHRRGVHAFWRQLNPRDLYRKAYQGLYCTGCEDFYLGKDLVAGLCPEHGTAPVEVAEDNYFFRLSSYQQRLLTLLQEGAIQIVPSARRNEILNFIQAGLQDISISRSTARAGGWGITVPGEPAQTIYVWIDALINYISGPGFGSTDAWRQWWQADCRKVHVIGKNVWKFHAIYWPALLLSAGLPLPDTIMVHGFVTAEGRKIGKSLGNAVDPFGLVERFGGDAVRYYLLRAIPPFDDGDFSVSRLEQLYRTDLANGIGNLVSRLANLSQRAGLNAYDCGDNVPQPPAGYIDALENFRFDTAAGILWELVDTINRQIESVKPWELLKRQAITQASGYLSNWLHELHRFAHWASPLLPATAARIKLALAQPGSVAGRPMFPRLS